VFGVFGLLRMCPDAVVRTVFCRVPGELAALYYNTRLRLPELLFTVRGVDFTVVRSCAATDFFAMVAGLCAYTCFRRRTALLTVFIFPVAWLVTVLANTIRLILLVPVTFLMYRCFPESTFLAIHKAVGTFVFLPLFIVLWAGVRYVTRDASA